jgi:NADH-quinone oxidoreductase subunit E
MSPAIVYGVATFYSHFALKPKGKNIIKVCNGTACHVKKSAAIIDAIRKKLGLKGNENTTKDMLFTLETVACLGACGLAPVIVINDSIYGQITPEKIVVLIDAIAEAK